MRVFNPRTATVVAMLAAALFVVTVPVAVAGHQLASGIGNGGALFAPMASVFVGWVIARRQPRNPMGWLVLGVALAGNVSSVASEYSIYAYRLHHDAGSLLAKAAVVLQPSWAPEIVCIGLIIVLFPDAKLPSGRMRWLLVALLTAGALWMLGAYAISVTAVLNGHVAVDATGNLLAIDHPSGATAWWGTVQGVCLLLLTVVWLMWLVRQLNRFRHARGQERQQLKWLLTGAVVFVVCFLVSLLDSAATPRGWNAVLSGVLSVGFCALPVTIGFGILRYRLYDIDRVISRTVSYGLVTAVLVGIYVGMVALTTQVLPFSSSIGVAFATVVSAALFAPLRRRMQRGVDRRFNRVRYDTERLVEAFAARLRDTVTVQAVSQDLLDAAIEAVEPLHVALWLAPSVTRP